MRGEKIGEITERKGDYCGGIYIEEEFLKFLGEKVGSSAINLVKDKHYSQLQYMLQEFCRRVKFPFNGERDDFKPFDLDLDGNLLNITCFSIFRINNLLSYFIFLKNIVQLLNNMLKVLNLIKWKK